MNRQQARELGLVKYTGGPTCKRGHNGERYVSTNACLLCSELYENKSTPRSEMTAEQLESLRLSDSLSHKKKRSKAREERNVKAVELMKSLGLDLPLTRSEAARTGSLYYFTGKPCIKGHVTKRATTGGCHQCGLDFAKSSKERKFAADPDAVRESDRKRYAANPERVKKIRQGYRSRNREMILAKARAYYASNPPSKESLNAINARRRASKLNATPPWTTPEMKAEMKAIYRDSIEMGNRLGVKFEVDHIIPLKGVVVSGLHVPWNLRIMTQAENRSRPKVFSDPHLGLAMPLGLGCGATIECYQL